MEDEWSENTASISEGIKKVTGSAEKTEDSAEQTGNKTAGGMGHPGEGPDRQTSSKTPQTSCSPRDKANWRDSLHITRRLLETKPLPIS